MACSCLGGSVGEGGKNLFKDVVMVQRLLNFNIDRLIPLALLKEDGDCGGKTRFAIEEFQRRNMNMNPPTKLVEPDSATIRELKAGLGDGFTEKKLAFIMKNARTADIGRYFPALTTAMAANNINTPLRMAHFLAQIGHESGDLRYSEELASGDAYEGRASLGNTQPGDGRRFKGRGLIQLTGRANYTAYSTARNADYTTGDNPRLIATDPHLAVDVSCWFWVTNGLNALADADNVREVTRTINGGYNGLDDRIAHLERAKCVLL